MQLSLNTHKVTLTLLPIRVCVFLLVFFFVFWLHWVFVAAHGLSLVAASGGYSSCGARASHCGGFSCGAQALDAQASVVAARRLSSCGARA